MKVIAAALLMGSAYAFQAPLMTVSLKAKKVAPKSATLVVKKAAPVVAKKAAPVVVKKAAPVVVKKAAPVVAKKIVPVVAKVAPVVAKKGPVKIAVKKAPVIRRTTSETPSVTSRDVFSGGMDSVALPLFKAPITLDGSLVGDVGFDPFGFSTIKTGTQIGAFGDAFADNIKWYREAELMHGRIAMMAALGFVFPGFAHLPGNEWTGVDAYAYTNPLEALDKAPGAAVQQIFCFMAVLEFFRIKRIQDMGASYEAGDFGWGQGEGRWNPYNFNYTPEEYKEKQLQELKNGRAAMMGVLGLYLQAKASGVGVVEQLQAALESPGYYAKAGYFFPDGI
mmetsp:Transcript_20628/g.29414  ORF Transcript_20628/g.29414 Transcript_20628/m.29414 type:complete len:336 (-) Transcript_20628:182-1189(-)|eukprot:CAMPEP_0172414084 /NCGR_PEP_ID=MMETSP1064-20121228/733_1 /TAXON_ID=202472 /ORGANISM="Aulacoseira subarctica , Strain CCAP 1002/5" /LENGTH=335 /DNA_ID=CAMNT_0013150581 /DNA_START=82 /DNA_END=1089 /DNA_ORIENTATION=+